jgi:hypothetical protein
MVLRIVAPSTVVLMDRFTLSSVIFACSGPHAIEFIGDNILTAYISAAFGFILVLGTVVFYFLRKNKGLPTIWFSVAVLVMHPAWTIGAVHGDCGILKASASKYATGVIGAGFLLQLLLWFVERRNQRGA